MNKVNLHPLNKKLCLLVLSIFWGAYSFAQQSNKIHGIVTSSVDNYPLSGVTVIVQGTENGTVTDDEGRFFIEANSSDTLTFSFIGYSKKSIEIKNEEVGNIKLEPSSAQLDQFVVVGYGTQKREDVTGAISNIRAEHFNSGVSLRPIQQIQGKIAGLVITQPDGDPNGEFSIRLRGQASLTGGQTPLIVVDGVPLDDPDQLSYISPNDIASYTVLKDASASAIYGSRGANGVILVTTKSGESGKTQVTYSGTAGIRLLSKEYDLLNAEEYRNAIGSSADFYDKGGNTNWFKAITKTGMIHSHNLAISGGIDNFNFRLSGTYINEQGIVINTGRVERGVNFKAEKKALNNKLDLRFNVITSNTQRNLDDEEIYLYSTTNPPTYPVFNPDGTYFGFVDHSQQNAVATQMMKRNKSVENFKLLSSVIKYHITEELDMGITGSFLDRNKQFSFFEPIIPGVGNFNSAEKSVENRFSQKYNVQLHYVKDWGNSHFTALIAGEYNDFINDSYGLGSREFLIEGLQDNALQNGNSNFNSISSNKSEFKLASVLGRVTYNYWDRYFLTASFRRDGSSKFGENHQWGNFPSFSLAWNLNNEGFLKRIKWIDEFKLNLGYGVTGNQNAIDPYNSFLTLQGIGNYYYGGQDEWVTMYSPNQNPNEDLRWEERHGKNIGLTFSLFGNKLNGNVNWFNDVTKHLLYTYNVPVPPFYVNTILANVGELTNKGLGVQLNAEIITNKDFEWVADGQITFINTKIRSLSGHYAGFQLETNDVPVGQAMGRGYSNNFITFLKVGYTPNVFFLPHFIGVNGNGEQLFSDGKGGEVTSSELVPLEMSRYFDPAPDFNYGFNSTFSYKNWSLNFLLRGVYGQKIFNNTRSLIDNITRLPGNNVTKEALTNGIKEQQIASDLWLENASYLRLDNVRISYNFKNLKRINNLNLFLTGNNLFVLTKYRGLDPEVSLDRIDYDYFGHGFYPRSRSFSFGVQISFE